MKIDKIFRFEVLRDGGSLIVSFQSIDSFEYWIMFPILKFHKTTPKFKNPILVNRTTDVKVQLSYLEAREWLAKLKPLFEERPELEYASKQSEIKVLNQMLMLCEVDV